MDITALLYKRNIKQSGIWKQMMWELYTWLLLVYCTLLFFWFISCYRKITRSFAHSKKLVYVIILNNVSIVYFAWKVCYLSLKISANWFENLQWHYTFWNVSKHFCGHFNSTEYECQPMKASQHMFILRKKTVVRFLQFT